MKVVVLSAIPIPVGHRVAVRWYHKKSKGLFGGAHDESHPTQPLIEDLETGIVYAFTWLYDVVESLQEEGENGALAWPSRFGETMVEGIEEQRVVTGRVTACRIFTSIQHGSIAGTCMMQTELTIAPTDESSAYR